MSGYTVIDGFYEDPMDVRSQYLARADEFVRPKGVAYPGVTFDGIDAIRDRTIATVADVLERPLIGRHQVRVATVADYARDDFNYTVHLDFTPYTAIVYLGLVDPERPEAEHPEYGTFLYEHRETGLRGIWRENDPQYRPYLEETGMTPEAYAELKVRACRDFRDASKWRRYDAIPYRFNRLVLHDAYRWFHSGPDRAFGHDFATGRMTANYFLEFDLRGLFAD